MTVDESTNLSSMVYYIRETLFENFKKDRRDLEKKWQKNLDAFNSVSSEYWKEKETEDWRSDTFVQITKVKTMAAFSIAIDMMLQANKIPFAMLPSPWDEVQFESMEKPEQQRIEDAIEEQKSLIAQQFLDCNADRSLIKNTMASAMMGETYAKLYVHEVKRTGFKPTSFAPEGMEDDGSYTRYEPFETKHNAPAWGYVSNWNIFRDMETEDMQAGVGIIERDFISPYQLAKKKDHEYWINDKIDEVIRVADKPGSQSKLKDKESLPPGLRDLQHRHKTIEMLEAWCRVPRKVVEQFEKDTGKEEKDWDDQHFENDYEHDGDEIECLVVVCDNEVVRFTRREDDDLRPYYRAVWEDSLDSNNGRGVPDNLEETQKVLNGMVRAFEDNKKLSANVLLAIKNHLLKTWDGIIATGNIPVSDEVDDVRQAIQQITIQDVGESLLSGIALFERYSDEQSMLPRIMQGTVAEKQKPDTLGEMSMLQQNAGKYIGGVLKNFDEGLIEPMVTGFYKYNMSDPELQRGKGNFIAQASGFNSFQNRIVKVQNILQSIQIALSHENLASEVKFRVLLEDLYKCLDVETHSVLKSPKEKQEEAAAKEQAMQKVMQEERMRMMDEAETQLMAKIDEINAEHQNALEMQAEKHQDEMEKLMAEHDHDIDMKAADAVSAGLVKPKESQDDSARS